MKRQSSKSNTLLSRLFHTIAHSVLISHSTKASAASRPIKAAPAKTEAAALPLWTVLSSSATGISSECSLSGFVIDSPSSSSTDQGGGKRRGVTAGPASASKSKQRSETVAPRQGNSLPRSSHGPVTVIPMSAISNRVRSLPV
jgi:hypothetical protein